MWIFKTAWTFHGPVKKSSHSSYQQQPLQLINELLDGPIVIAQMKH